MERGRLAKRLRRPEYGDGEEFDTYECMECLGEDPKHCTFDNPAGLTLEVPDDDD